jgi:hypothetical protein
MGYAIMSDGELVDWGVKNFKGKWSKERENKILQIFQRLVIDYQVSGIAIKISRSTQRSRNLERIYLLVRTTTKERRLKLSEFSIEELKQNCAKAKNKQELIQFLKRRFPELNRDLPRKTQDSYVRQFEAIAVTGGSL